MCPSSHFPRELLIQHFCLERFAISWLFVGRLPALIPVSNRSVLVSSYISRRSNWSRSSTNLSSPFYRPHFSFPNFLAQEPSYPTLRLFKPVSDKGLNDLLRSFPHADLWHRLWGASAVGCPCSNAKAAGVARKIPGGG